MARSIASAVFDMSFHLGKPVLTMLVIALITGAGIAMRPGRDRADLVVWVFAVQHQKAFVDPLPDGRPSLAAQFTAETGKTVDVQLISYRAQNIRMVGAFMAGLSGPQTPDLVEIEINQVGKYFRPPVDHVGLIPLNDYLRRPGLTPGRTWMDEIIPMRFTPWTKQGRIFGVPHDIHPTTISYRHDLFTEAGVDLPAARTWHEFQDACLRFQEYWRARGFRNRHALDLPSADGQWLSMFLLQRHINPIDDQGNVYLTDPRVANTLAFYAQLVSGPRKINGESTGGAGAFARDLVDGNICAYITPDWRVQFIKDYTPVDEHGRKVLEGKMRMMHLPVFEPGDAPTTTLGGTMMGIPRTCHDPEAAWKLLEVLYLSMDSNVGRSRDMMILPPVRSMWEDPVYHQPDPYFGGQRINEMFIELAPKVPARQVTPATHLAHAIFSVLLHDARRYIETRGTDGLEEACRRWLARAEEDLKRRMAHGEFSE